MNSLTTKQDYRDSVAAACKQLTEAEKNLAQAGIYQQLFNLPEFKKAKTILAYVSCQHEIDTQPLLTSCLSSEKQLLLPKINRKNISLHIYPITNLEQDLVCGPYANILEPKGHTETFPKDQVIDLIIIPAMAFDKKGQRLGRGMGYYDRFLLSHPESIVVGLAYEEQVFNEIPAETHDQPIDVLITPTQTFCFDRAR